MSLPASGTITLRGIKTEFGPAQNLTAYKVGAGLVANNEQNINIATGAATINLRQFYSSINVFISGAWSDGGSSTSSTIGKTNVLYNFYGTYNGNLGAKAGSTPPPNKFGTVINPSNVGVSRSNTARAQMIGIFDKNNTNSGTTISYVMFSGNLVNWAWTTIFANGVTMTRTSTSAPAGTYVSANNVTYWSQASIGPGGKGFFNTKKTGTYTITVGV